MSKPREAICRKFKKFREETSVKNLEQNYEKLCKNLRIFWKRLLRYFKQVCILTEKGNKSKSWPKCYGSLI